MTEQVDDDKTGGRCQRREALTTEKRCRSMDWEGWVGDKAGRGVGDDITTQ